jgi:hypothetical protein
MLVFLTRFCEQLPSNLLYGSYTPTSNLPKVKVHSTDSVWLGGGGGGGSSVLLETIFCRTSTLCI